MQELSYPQQAHRLVGLETEYGVFCPSLPRQQPELYSVQIAQAVRDWQAAMRPNRQAVAWDFAGENPLQDLRGTKLERVSAHPSLLTDDPHNFAPDGVETISARDFNIPATPMLTNTVLSNGGRFYVDHAHPEYSTPETLNSYDAVLWDAAGEFLARKAMEIVQSQGKEIVLYKNVTDGKGAAYGAHESYLLARALPYEFLKQALVGFLVTRPIICGAGRVGLGQHSEEPGFQLSARADFVGDLVGLQTTFNRPILNTRDEAHACAPWRRLHVINGDANRFQFSTLYRVASTRAWLSALELCGKLGDNPGIFSDLAVENPVESTWQVSRDIHFETTLTCKDTKERSALEWQWCAANRVWDYLETCGETVENTTARQDTSLWLEALTLLREDRQAAGKRIEWLGKFQVFEALSRRGGGEWSDPKLQALDLRWADLRGGASVLDKLTPEILFSPAQVQSAALNPPETTRAWLRGQAVRDRADLVAASWTTLVTQENPEHLRRELLPDFI